MMNLKVVSFNIRCANDPDGHSIAERAPRLAAVLQKSSPDLIGLQEYRDAWEVPLHAMLDESYDGYCQFRDEGPGREACPLFWKKDRFTCLKRGCFWLSDTPLVMSGGWDEIYHCNRTCLYVVLEEKTSGKQLLFMNTHFGFGDHCQTASADLIAEYAEKISGSPTVLTGDFNLTPSAAAYPILTRHFRDANIRGDLRGTYHGYHPEKIRDQHIDYCFLRGCIASQGQTMLTETFDGKFPSDHFGLEILLETTD